MAPTGSSILTLSKNMTLTTTSTPATAPMMKALTGLTNAQGDVMGDEARQHAVAHHARSGLP